MLISRAANNTLTREDAPADAYSASSSTGSWLPLMAKTASLSCVSIAVVESYSLVTDVIVSSAGRTEKVASGYSLL